MTLGQKLNAVFMASRLGFIDVEVLSGSREAENFCEMTEGLRRYLRGVTHGAWQRCRWCYAFSMLLTVCLTVSVGFAQAPAEHTLKAAYLYNFTRYIAWPDDAWSEGQQEFVIGVIGNNPFDTTLDQIAGKRLAQKRPLVIKYFKTLADYKPCHILFVAADSPADVHAAILRQTRNQPVLVVGERTGFAEDGATVNFVLLPDGSIRIEMNIDAMNRGRMQTSAQLLKLATVVRDRGAE